MVDYVYVAAFGDLTLFCRSLAELEYRRGGFGCARRLYRTCVTLSAWGEAICCKSTVGLVYSSVMEVAWIYRHVHSNAKARLVIPYFQAVGLIYRTISDFLQSLSTQHLSTFMLMAMFPPFVHCCAEFECGLYSLSKRIVPQIFQEQR